MLALKQHNAALSNLNIRIERHGDERQLAADLKLSMTVAGVVLDTIEAGLHGSMFKAPSAGDQPDLLDPSSLTAVKFPHLQPLVLTHKFPGYEAEVGTGLDDDEPLFLADLELKKITAKPLEGGSAELSFTLSGNIDADDVAQLADLLVREDVVLSITPPTRAQPVEDVGGAANDDGSTETCEGGLPDCGPVEFHDIEGVPLCKRCWDELPALDDAA